MKLTRLAGWLMIGLLFSSFLCGTVPSVLAQTNASQVAVKPININKASSEDLQEVRGIGPALAERIISYREANGGFKSLDQLKEVQGIGDLKFEKIKDQITV